MDTPLNLLHYKIQKYSNIIHKMKLYKKLKLINQTWIYINSFNNRKQRKNCLGHLVSRKRSSIILKETNYRLKNYYFETSLFIF